jgi:nucleoside-diphosphate-sugar epimerase
MIVTGGRGFIGSHLVDRLLTKAATVGIVDLGSRSHPRKVTPEFPVRAKYQNADLCDPQSWNKVCHGTDVVMHLAAKTRRVRYNVKHQGEMFFANPLINLHMLEAARLAGVDRRGRSGSQATTERGSPD